jgi:hypothetical protein
MNWVNFDSEWWSEGDRFGVMPCPNGWYGWDTKNSEHSETFRDTDDAKKWCQGVYDSETARGVRVIDRVPNAGEN